MVDGWYAERESRNTSTGPAGGRTSDLYYYSATGTRFRSRREVTRFFKLDDTLALVAQKKEREERLVAKLAAERRVPGPSHVLRSEEHRALHAKTAQLSRRAARLCSGSGEALAWPGAEASLPFVRCFLKRG